jgi:hypothetical protein
MKVFVILIFCFVAAKATKEAEEKTGGIDHVVGEEAKQIVKLVIENIPEANDGKLT